MYCCSCCYFCHPSWSWTQQQQGLIYAMRSLTQTQVSSGPKSNGARVFPLSECHPLRVSRWTHCTFSPNLFHSQIICLYVCSRVILFQIKSCSLYEKSMSSPMVFELRNYALHTVRSRSMES